MAHGGWGDETGGGGAGRADAFHVNQAPHRLASRNSHETCMRPGFFT
jgi:hypothetical protein